MKKSLLILKKDLRVVSRDRSALIFMFGMPLMFLLIFGSIFNGRGSGVPGGKPKVGLVNLDKGQMGAELLIQLQKMGLEPELSTGSEADLQEQVHTGKRAYGLVIPNNYTDELKTAISKRMKEGDKSASVSLHIFIDPAQTMMGEMVKGMAVGAANRAAAPLMKEAALEKVPAEFRDFARQNSGSNDDGTPVVQVATKVLEESKESETMRTNGQMVLVPDYAVLFVFFAANGIALSLIVERQEGTLRRLFCSPAPPSQILMGKLMARGVLAAIQTTMLFAIGAVMFHLTLGSSVLGILLTAIGTIFAATGLGLLIATFGKTPEQVAGMTTLALFMMGAVSGCMVPRMLLPESMQRFSLITPHAWALNAYQDIMLRQLPLSQTLVNIGMVYVFGAVFYGFALARFKYES